MTTQKSNSPSTRVHGLGLFIRGLAMGAADVVPGVSGGTIAFITGIYHQFIDALRSLSLKPISLLFKGQLAAAFDAIRQFHWFTLIPLGFGVAFSIVTLSKVVTTGMEQYPAATYALFFGLILFSAAAPYLQIERKNGQVFFAFAFSAVLAWLFVGLHPSSPEKRVLRAENGATEMIYAGKIRTQADVDSLLKMRDTAYPTATLNLFDTKAILDANTLPPNTEVFRDKQALSKWVDAQKAAASERGLEGTSMIVLVDQSPNLIWIFISGFIAISAMVLPGLSGSFLLLFLGLYHVIFGALHGVIGAVLGFLGRDGGPMQTLTGGSGIADFAIVLCFGFGVLLGLAVFSRIVAWLFQHAKDITLSALTGLMIGALRLPAMHVLDGTDGFTQNLTLPIIAAAIGAAAVLTLMRIDAKRAQKPA